MSYIFSGAHPLTMIGMSPHLFWSQALHVGALHDVLEVFVQISDVGIDSDLKGIDEDCYN